MKQNLAGVWVSIKIVLSYDILCLIDYLVKNLRKSIKPPQLWISNVMMWNPLGCWEVISQLIELVVISCGITVALAHDR